MMAMQAAAACAMGAFGNALSVGAHLSRSHAHRRRRKPVRGAAVRLTCAISANGRTGIFRVCPRCRNENFACEECVKVGVSGMHGQQGCDRRLVFVSLISNLSQQSIHNHTGTVIHSHFLKKFAQGERPRGDPFALRSRHATPLHPHARGAIPRAAAARHLGSRHRSLPFSGTR